MTANPFPHAPTVVVLGPVPGFPARTAPWDLELRGPFDAAALHHLLRRAAADGQDPGTGTHRLLRHAPDHHTLRCTATADTPAAAVAGRTADLLTTAAYGHPLTPAQRALLTRRAAHGYEALFLETAAGTDAETVRRALHTVVAAHPHLCFRLDTAAGRLTGPAGPGGQDLLTEGQFTDEAGFTTAVTALARTLDAPAGIHLRALLARDHRPSRPHTDRLALLTHELTADPTSWRILLTDLTRALGPAAVRGPAVSLGPAVALDPAVAGPSTTAGTAAAIGSATVPCPATARGPAEAPFPAAAAGQAAAPSSATAPGPAASLGSATASSPAPAADPEPAPDQAPVPGPEVPPDTVPGPAAGLSSAPAAGSGEAFSSAAPVPGQAGVFPSVPAADSGVTSSPAAPAAGPAGAFPSVTAPGPASVLSRASVRTEARAQCAGDGVADWVAGLRELARDPAEARHWSLVAERRSRAAASRSAAGLPPRPGGTADAVASPGTAPLPTSGTTTPGSGPDTAPDIAAPPSALETGSGTAADTGSGTGPETGQGAVSGNGPGTASASDTAPGAAPGTGPGTAASLPAPEAGPDTAPPPPLGTTTPDTGQGTGPETASDTGRDAAPEAGPGTAAPLTTPGTGPEPAPLPTPETGSGTTPETPAPPAPNPAHRTGFTLDEERTERITQHLARRLALTAEQVLTGVFALALARWQHTDEVGFDVYGDPRSGHPGLCRHVGRLTDVHPVQLTLDPGPDALGQLAAAAGFLAAGAGKAVGGAGFGACREFSPDPLLRATLRELPPAPTCLVLHAPDEAPYGPDEALPAPAHPVPGLPGHRAHRLQAHAQITGGRLRLTLDWLPDGHTDAPPATGPATLSVTDGLPDFPGADGLTTSSPADGGADLSASADLTGSPASAGLTDPSASDGLLDAPGAEDFTTPSASADGVGIPASDAPASTGRTAPSAVAGLPDSADTDDLTTPSEASGVTGTSATTALPGPPATPALPAPATPPTPSATALAPLLQDVLEELAATATAPIPSAFAPTAQQAALYTGGDAQPGTGRHVEQLVWVWHGPLDAERFGAAWQSVFDCEAVLRTAFTGANPPRLIVHGRVVPDITHKIPAGGDWAPFLERDRLRGFDLRCPGPLRLTVLETEQAPPAAPGAPVRIVLTYHRALLDTWSAHLLLRTFYRAYLAGGTLPGGERRPDLRDYTAWTAAQDPRPARALWARWTPPGAAPAASRPGRPGGPTGLSGVGRARLRLDAAETVRLARWAAARGTAESSVLQAVWAMLIHRASGATGPAPVCFAVTVPGRGIALDGAAWLPGPLRNLLPMSLEVDPADTVSRLLRHLRDRALDMAAYEWLPADPPPTPTHAHAQAGPDADRAETVLVFEDPPHPVQGLENELAAHGIRAEFPGTVPARSVLPLALLAHHDSTGGLVLTGVHDRALLDEAAAAELLVQSALLLRELPLGADEFTTVAQVLKLLEGRAVPPMADPSTTGPADPATLTDPTSGPTDPAGAPGSTGPADPSATGLPGPATTTDSAPAPGFTGPADTPVGSATDLPGPAAATDSAGTPGSIGPADPPAGSATTTGPAAVPGFTGPADPPAAGPAIALPGPPGPGTPLTLLRAARHRQAGTICLVPPPGAPPTCYDLLPPAYPGPQELLLLTTPTVPADSAAALAARTAGRPLLLAGFSGAGTVACDLARRLAAAGGRRPPRVVLTPAPPGERERARVLARALQDATAPPP